MLKAEVQYYPGSAAIVLAVVFIFMDAEERYFIVIHKPVLWSNAISSHSDHVSKAKNEIKTQLQINVNSKDGSHRKCYWTAH